MMLKLVSLAFFGSISLTLVLLACALPGYQVWWPLFVVLFQVLTPIPTLMARRFSEDSSGSNSCLDLAIFITMGFVVSSFALPIVLARSPETDNGVIKWGACYLTLTSNIVAYLTIIGFFITSEQDDSDYSVW